MRTIRIVVTLGLLAAAHLSLHLAPATAAEEGTVQAVAAWQGQGRFYQTGKDQALFFGAFGGTLFLQNQTGALDAAKLLCPTTLELNLNDGTQSAEGRCIVTARSGDRAFARWRCTGKSLQGCTGKFELTGGTGKLLGITGESEFMVRSGVAEFAVKGDETVQETAAGLAVWPALKYRIP
jgi:hypothetical protein